MNTMHLIAVCALALIIGGGQAEARDMQLTKDGKSDYTIVLSKDASPSEKHAADELQKFLLEISGAKLPIATEGDALPKHMIVLGDGNALRSLNAKIDLKDLGDEGLAIKTLGPHLVIAGGRQRGTMYGVYTFLEDVLGCRWYTPKVSRIPKTPTITIKPLNIVQKPDFEYRYDYYYDAFDQDWSARQKSNGITDEAHGGCVKYGRFVHTFHELVPADKYYNDHPEYYALYGNERIKTAPSQGQLCLSNPEVLKIATETVLGWCKSDPSARIWSVSQNDYYSRGGCECEKCKAIDAEEGSPSGAVLRFVNAIADEVAKQYPNVLIDTLAYLHTEAPPKLTGIRPNVRIRLCPIGVCEMHPYATCDFPASKNFMSNFKGWTKMTDNLYIWHYNNAYFHLLAPYPSLEQLAASFRMYKDNGVKGVFMEGNNYCGGAMDELNSYVTAKCLWNTRVDARAVRDDFLNGYFGKAGKPIREWLDLLQNEVRTRNIHMNPWPQPPFELMTPQVIAASDRLFDEAERVADDPDVLERVKHARLSLRYVEVDRDVRFAAAAGSPEQKAAVYKEWQEFVKDCRDDGIVHINIEYAIDESTNRVAKSLGQEPAQ